MRFRTFDRLLVPREELPMFDEIETLPRFHHRRVPLDDSFKLTASITSIEAHDHEVGHTAFAVSSAGDTLLIWGDVVHVPSI